MRSLEKFSIWCGETQDRRIELVRHFLPSLGGNAAAAAPIIGAALSSWMLLFALFGFKYKKLEELGLQARIPLEAINDGNSLAAMGACLCGVLIAVLWQSIYPSLRDYLALAGMPVSGADLFQAKAVSLFLVFAIYLLALPLPAAAVLFAFTGTFPLGLICKASAIAFFGLTGFQGLLLNSLPARWFERAMVWSQAIIAAASLAGFPVAMSRGHLWFPQQPPLWLALAAPAASVLLFLVSFHRYRRLVIESPLPPGRRSYDFGAFLARDPREQAVLSFFLATLRRSRQHRLTILVFLGLSLAWLAKSIATMPAGASAHEVDRLMYSVYPLALMLITVGGMRYLFVLPAELRANWIFGLTEREGRTAWMRAVEKFVFAFGIGPVALIGGLLVTKLGGPMTGAAWAAAATGLGAIAFERLFRDWRILSFTCEHRAAKRPLLLTISLYVAATPVLLIVAWFVFGAATNPAGTLLLLLFEALVWYRLRHARLQNWGLVPLHFTIAEEGAVDRYEISAEGTTVARENFQREWNDLLRSGPHEPMVSDRMPGETNWDRLRSWLAAFPQDVRQAIRMLWKSPGFVATIVLTLGLGLGLNSAFFTLFNAYLLKPLIVRDPSTLVSVELLNRRKDFVSFNWQEFEAFAATAAPFSEVAASTLAASGLSGQSARVALVSPNFFSMLGVAPALGRVLTPEDEGQVLVLNYRTWQTRFGGDPKIAGRTLELNGKTFEVAGVAQESFGGVAVGTVMMIPPQYARYGIGEPDVYVSARTWSRLAGAESFEVLGIVGRLRPGFSEKQAAQAVYAQSRRMTASRPEYRKTDFVNIVPLEVSVTWTALSFSIPLLVAFGLTMLAPCANAANILLARAAARMREFGTRFALGASRGRVVRQLLTEGLMLSVLAAAFGYAVSRFALGIFTDLVFSTAPPTLLNRMRVPDLSPDSHIAVYMLLIACLTTGLFALAPAALATRAALRNELGGLQGGMVRNGLIVAQVALCVSMVASSGLLLRGIKRLTNVERGYDVTRAFRIRTESLDDARALFDVLGREPWVETAAVTGRPVSESQSVLANGSFAYALYGDGNIFDLLGLRLVKGRTFSLAESARRLPVAVITEGMARALWPGQDPLGKTVELNSATNSHVQVVGVVQDFVVKLKDGGPRPAVFLADTLRPGTGVAVRGRGSGAETRRLLNAVLPRTAAGQHGAWIVGLSEVTDWETYPQQAVAWLATLLGAISILLTMTGIYSVMAYFVSLRRKEIGIRIALGAASTDVIRFLCGWAARLGLIGAVFGVILAAGLLQYLRSEIDISVDLLDLAAYAITALAGLAAATAAVFLPARRACTIDPQASLRVD